MSLGRKDRRSRNLLMYPTLQDAILVAVAGI